MLTLITYRGCVAVRRFWLPDGESAIPVELGSGAAEHCIDISLRDESPAIICLKCQIGEDGAGGTGE